MSHCTIVEVHAQNRVVIAMTGIQEIGIQTFAILMHPSRLEKKRTSKKEIAHANPQKKKQNLVIFATGKFSRVTSMISECYINGGIISIEVEIIDIFNPTMH